MADFFTHYYLGKEVLKYIKKDLDKNSFLLGCQGPDIFYFEKYAVKTNPPNLGYLMHYFKIKESFELILCELKKSEDIILKSYIYGFFTHYILDKNIHPYVDSKKKFSHKKLEAAIDTYIMKYYLNSTTYEVSINKILKDNLSNKSIFKLYKLIAIKIYNLSLFERQYHRGIKNYIFFQRIFNNSSKIFRIILKSSLKLFKPNLLEYMYLEYDKIYLPDDIEKIHSILDDSIKESLFWVEKIDLYLKGDLSLENLLEYISNINYLGK